MADDEQLSGRRSVATDEISSVGYQIIKLSFGALNTATLVHSSEGLPVNIVADGVGIGGGTQYTEDAAAAANPVGTAVNLIRADTPAGVTSTDGDNVAQRGTNFGASYVTLLDSAGAEVSVGGGTQYDEDTAHTAAEKVTMAGVVRKDTAATLVGADSDRTELIVDANGRLHVIEPSAAAATTALQVIDDWDNAASDGASVSGDVAHDTADAGEPVKIGAKAYSPDGTTPGTAVAENDRSNLKSDLDGRLFIAPEDPTAGHYHDDDTAAVTTDGTLAADPGDGFSVFIKSLTFSIGAATASSIFVEEGSTKILGPYYLEAIAGRGCSVTYDPPKRCTASTAILVTNTGSISFSVDVDYFVAAV